MSHTISTDASPSFPLLDMVKSFTMSEMKYLLAQRPLARYLVGYFDDNKPYLVMYLTSLFKSISG